MIFDISDLYLEDKEEGAGEQVQKKPSAFVFKKEFKEDQETAANQILSPELEAEVKA